MTSTIEVLRPVADVKVRERKIAPLLDRLDGKRVGYHHARGPYLQVVGFADRLGELLLEKYGVTEYPRLKSIVDNGASGWSDPRLPGIIERVYDEYAARVDCAVVAAGFCGGSTFWSIHAACELQDRGVPTVSLVSAAFMDLALFTCQARGYREIPMLVLPNDFESKQPHELVKLAEQHVDEAVGLLAKQTVLVPAGR